MSCHRQILAAPGGAGSVVIVPAAALAARPEAERTDWRGLRAGVDALLRRAGGTAP